MEFGHREVTELVRAEWPGTLILNPHKTGAEASVTPEAALEVLQDDLADAVSLASLWLANPDLDAAHQAPAGPSARRRRRATDSYGARPRGKPRRSSTAANSRLVS
ncbi:Alkene reductase OS=Streptomyces microflavus OX=1919 GN=Smic_36880 PE=4 SV=1 [Streptomyces microflavus]